MKKKKKQFVQDLYHEIENEDEAEKYLDESLPSIGYIVMYFNGLEQSLDRIICDIFTTRAANTGLIVLHKMNYSAKVDLFKRFCDDLHSGCNINIDGYDLLIKDLRESGRLRNLVVHADWESTDKDGYTYVNFKISKNGMEQEYIQFSQDSLSKIITHIIKTNGDLYKYWEERNEKLYS